MQQAEFYRHCRDGRTAYARNGGSERNRTRGKRPGSVPSSSPTPSFSLLPRLHLSPWPCFLNAFLYYQVPGTALSSYSWILCYPRFLPFLPSALTPGTEQTTLLSLSAGYPPRFRGEEPELRGAIQEWKPEGIVEILAGQG